jgi:hypothetical protein
VLANLRTKLCASWDRDILTMLADPLEETTETTTAQLLQKLQLLCLLAGIKHHDQ